MSIPNLFWYTRDNGTTGWSGVAKWAASTAYAPGSLVRQLTTPAVGNERVFLSISAATQTSSPTTEPTWVITKGGVVVDNTNITWQEVTGQPAVNGDTVNTPTWAVNKAAGNPSLGFIIQDNAGVNLFICSTAGSIGSTQPTFNTSSFGITTTDNSAVWKYIGTVTAYADWAAPHARIANAMVSTWGQAGDTHCVGSDHAETQTTLITLNGGTSTTPVFINCISTATIPPTTTTTGASVSLTGAANINVCTGSSEAMFINGITFNLGTTLSGASSLGACGNSNSVAIFENCTFNLLNTTTTSNFAIGSTCSSATFRGCFFTAANASQGIAPSGGYIDFIGCDLFQASGTKPSAILIPASFTSIINIRGCTYTNSSLLVAAVSVSADITVDSNNNTAGNLPQGNGTSNAGPRVRYANAANTAASSGSSNFGAYFASTTTAYRTGGGVDASWGNTTGTSLSGNTSAILPRFVPFESQPITLWCSTTGVARTLTVYLTSFSTLNNSQFWITVEYFDSGTTNHAAELSTRANPVVTPTALTADSSTWTNGQNIQYSISATVTPQQIGPIKVRLYCTGFGTILNVDPLVVMV
jgi:hypothetical protein